MAFGKGICCLAVVVLPIAMQSIRVWANEIPKKVTEDEAIDIAGTMFGPSVGDGGFDVTEPKNFDPFYLVMGLGPNGGAGGWWAVNPWTGDIWDVELCFNLGPITSPEIRAIQAKIRKRFTKAELKSYPRLHRLEPNCLNNDYRGEDLPVR